MRPPTANGTPRPLSAPTARKPMSRTAPDLIYDTSKNSFAVGHGVGRIESANDAIRENEMRHLCAALAAALALTSATAMAADYPAPRQGDWIAKNFRFHTGDTMGELRLHYTTVGEPTG